MLRWDAPLQLFERWVLEPGVVIAGQELEVGQEVAMLFGSAERDPRRFDEPDRFDVGRNDPAHIGFGGGIHFCVGAPLARQEIEVSLAGLVRRFPNLEMAAEPDVSPELRDPRPHRAPTRRARNPPLARHRRQSSWKWQTASTLFPSGSRTNAP